MPKDRHIYLVPEEILALHKVVIEESGGSFGVRDISLIASACGRPQATFGGNDLYPDLYTKAAALMHSLALNHAFIDGNKRVSFVATARFLFINNHLLNPNNKEIENFVVSLVENHLEIKEIAVWLKNHTKHS